MTVEFLNCLQGRDKMIREFKFFHGLNKKLRVVWQPELVNDLNYFHAIDAEEELTNILSQEIARTIDEEMINELTRRINGGYNQFEGPIIGFNNNRA